MNFESEVDGDRNHRSLVSFESWAKRRGHDIAHSPVCAEPRYANAKTQAAFLAWKAGAGSVARDLVPGDFETKSLIDRVLAFCDRER